MQIATSLRGHRASLVPAASAVAVTAALTGAAGLLQDSLSNPRSSGFALTVATLPLFFLFWLASTWLVDAGVTLLGEARRTREYLVANGVAFPILLGYPAALLAQSGLNRLGWGGANALWSVLAVADLMFFAAWQALAIKRIYAVSGMGAISLALLPYAAMALLSLVLALVL